MQRSGKKEKGKFRKNKNGSTSMSRFYFYIFLSYISSSERIAMSIIAGPLCKNTFSRAGISSFCV